MNKSGTLSIAALLSFALVAGAYAAQGQEGAGSASGQPTPPSGITKGSPAQPSTAPSVTAGTAGPTATIEGELLRIDGEYYVVKDTAGKEVRLHVDKTTKLDGNIVAKDLIVARASQMPSTGTTAPEPKQAEKSVWHADSIKKR
jgi:uncharacterized protein YdeI (BOF family)